MSDESEDNGIPKGSGNPKHDAMTDAEIEDANQRILDLLDGSDDDDS